MKRFAFFALILVLASGCIKDKCQEELTYVRYDRVYVTPDEFRSAPISFEAPRTLEEPGKIYFYNNYILINEIRKGLHIIDNTNAENPVNTGFIAIEGNHDMAIKNDVLYADAYTDLVIMDLSNMNQPVMKDRVEDVFSSQYFSNSIGIMSHFEPTDVTERIDCSDERWGNQWFGGGGFVWVEMADNANFANASGPRSLYSNASGNPQVNTTGQGGSMARFTITKNHLYAVGDAEIFALPIQTNGFVGSATRTGLPWGIETIYPYEDYLFIGASNGMHIMTLDNPSQPEHASTFSHANACDPVVVQDDIAFVTLRGGTPCGGFTNQLEVLDVSDIFNPKLLHTYSMDNPHGLAILDNLLFICEGQHGLKVFDAEDISKINQNLYSHIKGFHAYDAIALRGHSLLVIGDDGFRQYDYSNPSKLSLMSHITVQRP